MQLKQPNKPRLMHGQNNVFPEQPPSASTLSLNCKISGPQTKTDSTASLHPLTWPPLMVS